MAGNFSAAALFFLLLFYFNHRVIVVSEVVPFCLSFISKIIPLFILTFIRVYVSYLRMKKAKVESALPFELHISRFALRLKKKRKMWRARRKRRRSKKADV